MRPSTAASITAAVIAGLTVASCAAIGGLGDFTEVPCVGACDDGGSDGATVDSSDQPDSATGPDAEPLLFGTVGGNVSGLLGTGLVLKNNGADDLQVASSGPFTFPARVKTGDPYAVTVGSQPSSPTQVCSVANGAGTIQGANVTNVAVTCATNAYNVGGNVVGLTGAGLVLTNNGGDDKAIGASGPFTFATKVASGGPYAVAIKTQPSSGGPCTVSGGSGTVGVADVSSIVVNCAPGTYTVGGNITGLNGTVVLQDNGGNDLTLTGNGAFAFSQTLADLAAYAVTVKTQPGYPPRAQTCTVTSGSGNIAGANVTNVAVNCTTNTYTIGGNVSGLTGTLVLKDNGGDNLTLNASGGFTFATKVASGSTYAVTVGTQPTGQTCTVTSGSGTVTSGNVVNVTVTCATGSSDPGIRCDTGVYCPPATQFCCFDRATGKGTCLANGTTCATQAMECDDSADCGGGVCCARYSKQTSNLADVRCKASASLCTPTPQEIDEFWCDPGATSACPGTMTCTGSSMTSPYKKCL